MELRKKLNRLIYSRDYELIKSTAKKDMDFFIVEALFGTLFTLLTSGIFLTGYLIYLGASDVINSFMPQITNICGIFLIFFTKPVANKDKRQSLVIFLSVFSKITLLSIILVPLFFPHEISIPIVYFLLIVGYSINSIYSLAINTWFVGVIPIEIRGRYYSIRQIYCILLSTVIPVASGKILDLFQNQYFGFCLMYTFALVSFIIQTYVYSKISDPRHKTPEKSFKVSDVFLIPMKNKEFLKYTFRLCAFQIILNMSFSFSYVFMLKYLGLNYTYISILGVVSAILQAFIFYKFWGILTDKLGANFTLLNSIWFFVFDALGWVFIRPSNVFIILPICYCFGAINISGYTVGSFNRRYELIEEENRVLYESFFVTLIGVAFLIAPILGSILRNIFEHFSFLEIFQFGNFRTVYLITVILIIVLQIFYIKDIKKTEPSSMCLNKQSYKYAIKLLKHVILRRV